MRQISVAVSILLLFVYSAARAQDDNIWTLQEAVKYAIDHNISIRQNELNARLAALRLKQSRLGQLPSVNTSGSYGRSFGRSVDPTTNQFVTGASYDFISLSANADVLLFGWFQKRNTINANKFNLEANKADLDQLKDDISLNVATGYLRALLASEQIKVSKKQVELSKAQLEQTRSFADAGRLPELNVAQLESQLANDSANLIQAFSDYTAAILDIKALLNLDFEESFELERPEIKEVDQLEVATMEPLAIYNEARRNMGSIKSSELKLIASQKNLAAARGNMFPQLSLSGQMGSNYSTTYKDYHITGLTSAPLAGTYAVDTAGGGLLPVYQQSPVYTTSITPLGKQLDNNFRQTIALALNIPLFNGWQSQFNMRQAKINVMTQELNKYQTELTLKQNVYKAYNDARNSIQKYYAAERAAVAAQRAFDFAQKRYDLGLTNTVEYLTTQNTLYSADSRLASAKYDLIFKLKVIDYYLGNEIKL